MQISMIYLVQIMQSVKVFLYDPIECGSNKLVHVQLFISVQKKTTHSIFSIMDVDSGEERHPLGWLDLRPEGGLLAVAFPSLALLGIIALLHPSISKNAVFVVKIKTGSQSLILFDFSFSCRLVGRDARCRLLPPV